MKEVICLVENSLIKNQETISLNALKEICKTYGIYNDSEIIKYFKEKNLININSKSNYLPNCLQIDFIKKARNNDELAKKLLVITNYNLVVFIVNRLYRDIKDKEDLIQYGLMGLLHAIDNCDFNKDTLFVTYASKCINGTIKKYLPTIMNSLKIDRNIYYLCSRIVRIEEKLMKDLNKENISDLEILNELKKDNKYNSFTEKSIYYLRNYSLTKYSLDKEIIYNNQSTDDCIIDFISSDENIEETVITNLTYDLIGKILNKEIESNLTERELSVIYYRYGFDKLGILRTSEETGKILGISGSRTRLIERNAISKLKKLDIFKNIK